jgi:hypothetical protein
VIVGAPFQKKDLIGRWVHSHEEDSPGRTVFRPGGFAFPPSRGRRAFELKADGSLVEAPIGPADAPVTVAGRWRLAPNGRLKLEREGAGAAEELEIDSLSAERLVVRRR